MSEFTTFLADCWRMFEDVTCPVLNISFAKVYLGVFVVSISIVILRPLLGIGGTGFAGNLFRGLTRSHSSKSGYDSGYNKRVPDSQWYGTKTTKINPHVRIRYKSRDRV